MIWQILIAILILLAPLLGGLVYGVERKVRARMQNRKGPSLFQPFFDFFKLMDKRPIMVHSTHAFLGIMHFVAMWFAVAGLFMGWDLMIVVFLHLLASSLLILGGFSAKSVFSHLGANRMILSTLCYEPILLLIAVCVYKKTGSFDASSAYLASSPLILSLPGAFLALMLILPIKLKKSPYDIAEAHQEVVGGAEIEYSGIFFEFIYTARWLEYLFVYGLVFLFFGFGSLWSMGIGALAMVIIFILVNAVDCSVARLNYQFMMKMAFMISLPLVVLNMLALQ